MTEDSFIFPRSILISMMEQSTEDIDGLIILQGYGSAI